MKGSSILFSVLSLLILIVAAIGSQTHPVGLTRAAVAARAQTTSSDLQPVPLRLTRRIMLQGVLKRIDHLAANPDGQQLFVAALGNNSLEVIDLKAGKPALVFCQRTNSGSHCRGRPTLANRCCNLGAGRGGI